MKDLKGFKALSVREDLKLRAIDREQDPEIQAFELLTFARELKAQGRDTEAAALFQTLRDESIPAGIRQSANKEWEAMSGQGNAALRAEYLTGRFVQDAVSYKAIVPMILGTAAYGVLRAGAAARLANAGGFFSRGLGLRWGAAALGSAAEIPVFALSSRALHGMAGDPVRESVAEDLASAGIVLGTMKLMGWTAGQIPVRPEISQQGGMLAGIAFGHHLETAVGLRPHLDAATTWVDSLAMLLAFNVGGRFTQGLMGHAFRTWKWELDHRARNSATPPIPAPPPPRGGRGLLNEFLLGHKTHEEAISTFPSPLVGEGPRRGREGGRWQPALSPLLAPMWMMMGARGPGGGGFSRGRVNDPALLVFLDKYAPRPESHWIQEQSHAGKILEFWRRDPKLWENFLQNRFGGSEKLFWETLDELAASPVLAEITWLHGSRSSSLALLPRAGGRLLPTGQLLRMGLTVFSGELGYGISNRGVNLHEISGLALHNLSGALRYARKHFPHFDWEDQWTRLQNMLERAREETPSEVFNHMFLNRAILVARRLHFWDAERLNAREPQLQALLGALKTSFPHLEKEIEAFSKEVKHSVYSPLTESERGMILAGFPLIYASTTIPNRELKLDGDYREWGARQEADFLTGETYSEATLSQDIQVLFTPHGRTEDVRQWLSQNHYYGVQVKALEILDLLGFLWMGHSKFRNREAADLGPGGIRDLLDEVEEYARDARVLRSGVSATPPKIPAPEPEFRKYFHVRGFHFTRGYEQKISLPGREPPLSFGVFMEAETPAQFGLKLERLLGFLRGLPPRALASFRRVEIYEKPAPEYGFDKVSGLYSVFPRVVRLFGFSRRTNPELIDILTHEIVGHGLLFANRSNEELKALKTRIVRAMEAAGPDADEFYSIYSGSEHFRRDWKERFATAVTLYRISPDLVKNVDPDLVEVVEEVLEGYPVYSPGRARAVSLIRKEMSESLALSRSAARKLIRETASPHTPGTPLEKFQALAELGRREDFEDFSVLFSALDALAKRQEPVDFQPLVETLWGNAGVEFRQIEGRVRYMEEKEKLKVILKENPLAGFLVEPIQQMMFLSDGPLELEDLLVKFGQPMIGNAILMMEAVGKIASNPQLREEDHFFWLLRSLKKAGRIFEQAAIHKVEVGAPLLNVVTHPHFRGPRNMAAAVEVLGRTVHEQHLGFTMGHIIENLLANPDFVLSDHLPAIVEAIHTIFNPTFRLTMWRDLVAHPQFQGEENFSYALKAIFSESPGARRRLPEEEIISVRRMTLQALGEMGGNPNFSRPEDLITQIVSLEAPPDEKSQALVKVSKNPHFQDQDSFRDLIDEILKNAGTPKLMELDLNEVVFNPQLPPDVRDYLWMKLNSIDPAMARRLIFGYQSRQTSN